jgi:hypothetical protein
MACLEFNTDSLIKRVLLLLPSVLAVFLGARGE